MAADYEAVTNDVRGYVTDVRDTMPIDRVYLFGSYAKGSATEQSDVDLCFFLDSFGEDESVDITARLIGMTHKYDAFIEPHVFLSEDIANGNPFIKEIIKTGKEL